LEVNGAVKIGTTENPCSATNEGAIRYNATLKKMEFCNGVVWELFNSLPKSCADQKNISPTSDDGAYIIDPD